MDDNVLLTLLNLSKNIPKRFFHKFDCPNRRVIGTAAQINNFDKTSLINKSFFLLHFLYFSYVHPCIGGEIEWTLPYKLSFFLFYFDLMAF